MSEVPGLGEAGGRIEKRLPRVCSHLAISETPERRTPWQEEREEPATEGGIQEADLSMAQALEGGPRARANVGTKDPRKPWLERQDGGGGFREAGAALGSPAPSYQQARRAQCQAPSLETRVP